MFIIKTNGKCKSLASSRYLRVMKRELKPQFVELIGEMSKQRFGACFKGLVEALESTDPVVAIRPNLSKSVVAVGSSKPVEWGLGHERRVDGERPRFTLDPAFHQGLYYVQDPSSMVIASVVRRLTGGCDRPLVYIDACAAPGGKTTAAIDALPQGSLVIANEFDRRRAETLKENVAKWGVPGVVVTQGDTAALRGLGPVADIVAVDAPCSGEGMMRKDADARAQWSPELVARCAALQREILENAWRALRPGGYLIYSTCTFNPHENDQNVVFMIDELGAEAVDFNVQGAFAMVVPVKSLLADGGGCPIVLRFIPSMLEGEGLFMTVVRKPAGAVDAPPRRSKPSARKQPKAAVPVPAEVKRWLSGDFSFKTDGQSVVAVPASWAATVDFISTKLNVIAAGVEVATAKGRDYQPTQQLAMSSALSPGAFARCEVGYQNAIAYLRGEAVDLSAADPEPPRGFILLTYRGRPLGFVKNIGNRANNLYPKPWTIKTTHVDAEPPAPLVD